MYFINNLHCVSKEVTVTRFISEDFVSAERFFCPDCESNELTEDHGLP